MKSMDANWLPTREDNAEIVFRGESRRVSDISETMVERAIANIRKHDGATIRGRRQLAEFCAKWFVNHDSVYDAGR